MKTIWKYELTPNRLQSVPLPFGGQILTVKASANNAPMLWALVDPDMPVKDRRLAVFTTNTELPDDPGKYLATFTLYEGSLEFHVFEFETVGDESGCEELP